MWSYGSGCSPNTINESPGLSGIVSSFLRVYIELVSTLQFWLQVPVAGPPVRENREAGETPARSRHCESLLILFLSNLAATARKRGKAMKEKTRRLYST
jgi:hypothetical protein